MIPFFLLLLEREKKYKDKSHRLLEMKYWKGSRNWEMSGIYSTRIKSIKISRKGLFIEKLFSNFTIPIKRLAIKRPPRSKNKPWL